MKALLFDMDGTLVDSMGAWFSADLGYLQKAGADISQVDYNALVTAGMEEAFKILRQGLPDSVNFAEARKYALQQMEDFYRNRVELKPGVAEMLAYFVDQGIPMAIGSSTPLRLCQIALDRVGVLPYFDFVFSATDSHIPKDQERFFHQVADQFGLEAEKMAVFDDAIYAVKAAKRAGSYALGIEDGGYGQDARALAQEADYYIEDFQRFDYQTWLSNFAQA